MPLALEKPTVSFPLCVGSGSSESGPRLGGRAPDGVAPSGAGLQYFFTVPSPFEENVEISVFIDPRSEFVFGGAAGKVVSDGGVDVVAHTAGERGAGDSVFDAGFSEHPLLVGDVRPDLKLEDGEELPLADHKMGGRPYFVHGQPELEDAVEDLLTGGFIHLVQLDFPVNEGDAEVLGQWPVGPALFHVLVRAGTGTAGFEWRAFWEV